MTVLKNWFGQKRRGLRCAAVTPVGPGHVERARDCRASIEAAWRESHGPFSELEFCFIDDSRGELGRSKARNVGTEAARKAGADWIFFLDADDLMTPHAFSIFSDYADRFDAVWGLMAIKPPAESGHHIRFPQALTLRSVDELLLLDPFMTLLMGHFVRTNVALELPFDETMDAGEDFDYYIRAWQKYRCIKIAEVLSVNRSDQHSSGPRAATAAQWRVAATERLSAGLLEIGRQRHSTQGIAAVNRCSEEAQAFSRARDEASLDTLLLMSRSLPYRGFVDVSACAGGDFVLFSNNDDLVSLSIGWIGDYLAASTRLWQALARDAPLILDIGAYTGYFGLLAARAAPAADVVCFEPLALNFSRLELNLALNNVRNVRAIRTGVADKGGEMQLHVPAAGAFLPAAATLIDDGRPFARSETVQATSIDSFLGAQSDATPGLIRIDAGKTAGDVVAGMAQMFQHATPDLLISLEGAACTEQMDGALRQLGYRFYVVNESEETIVATERLTPAAGVSSANRWVTARSADAAASIIAAAYCSAGGVSVR